MKIAVLLVSLFVSTNLFAAEPFKKYSIPGEGEGFISTQNFSSVEEVVQFCQDNGGEMIEGERTTELVLYFAMSGLALEDEFLEKALTFSLESKTESESGAWFWEKETGKVVLWYDGKGFTMEAFSVEELKEKFPGNEIALPAMCELPNKN